MFLKLRENGYIYLDTTLQPYCETDKRFLADRYVEGKCPHCGFDGASTSAKTSRPGSCT